MQRYNQKSTHHGTRMQRYNQKSTSWNSNTKIQPKKHSPWSLKNVLGSKSLLSKWSSSSHTSSNWALLPWTKQTNIQIIQHISFIICRKYKASQLKNTQQGTSSSYSKLHQPISVKYIFVGLHYVQPMFGSTQIFRMPHLILFMYSIMTPTVSSNASVYLSIQFHTRACTPHTP